MPTVLDFPDYNTPEGARAHAAMISAYWRERGQNVTVWVEQVMKWNGHRAKAMTAPFWGVRSDTINGKPREAP